MDPAIIRTFQIGQGEEQDEVLESILVERGLFRREEAQQLRRAIPPGALGEELVRLGRLSPDQLEQFEREAELREILDAMGESTLPPEVEGLLRTDSARVGKFVLVSLLGRGGMGEVWKAWDTQLSRWVALKFLHGNDLTEVKRFLREATLAAKLSHPGIAKIYEVGASPPRPYIAMQYVAGSTLATFPRSDRKLLAQLLRDAAVAVHAAHENGVVHRDLKPLNIMVEGTPHPRPKTTRRIPGKIRASGLRLFVMDFGLAKTTELDSSLSKSGALLGTPAYMSPEQALGRLHEVGPRSDVYSLGATLYELLAGRPPFVGRTTYQIIVKVIQEEPRPLQRIHPDIDRDLETIVMKCLEKDAKRRYPSALALAEDLTRYLDGEAIEAHPPSTLYRFGKFVSRRKGWLLGAAGAVLALATAAILIPKWAHESAVRKTREQELTQQREKEAEEFRARERARPHLDAGRTILIKADRLLMSPEGDEEEVSRMASEARNCLYRALAEYPGYPEAHLEMARSYLMEDRRVQARECCTRAIQESPSFATAYLERAILDLQEIILSRINPHSWMKLRPETPEQVRRMAAIEEDFRTVRRWSTDAGELLLAEGILLLADERLSEAATKLEQYAKMGASDIRGWLWTGLAWISMDGKEALEQGIQALTSMLAYRPRHAYALFLRAASRGRRGALLLQEGKSGDAKIEWSAAIADYDKLIRINPNDPRAYWARAQELLNGKHVDRALADFEAALRLDPSSHPAHQGLGISYIRRSRAKADVGGFREALADIDLAIHHLTKSSELENRDGASVGYRGDARVRRSEVLRSMGEVGAAKEEREKAIADYDQAVALGGGPNVLVSRALFHREEGRMELALADYAAALALDPRMSMAYAGRANLRASRGELDAAIQDYTEALKFNAGFYDALFNRGIAHGRRAETAEAAGDAGMAALELDLAVKDYSSAIELEPRVPDGWGARSAMHKRKSDILAAAGRAEEAAAEREAAIHDIEQALEIAPKDWVYRPAYESWLKQLRP